MTNKQNEIEIEDETTVVRVLSIVFLMLMALIVSSYSDITPAGAETAQHTETQTQSTKNILTASQVKNGQFNIIKTHIKKEPGSLITYN